MYIDCIEEKFKENYNNGYDNGYDKGYDKGIQKIITEMLKNNYPISEIEKITEQNKEHILKIKENTSS